VSDAGPPDPGDDHAEPGASKGRRRWWVWAAVAALLIAAAVTIWAVQEDDTGDEAESTTTIVAATTTVPTTTTVPPSTSTTTTTTAPPPALTLDRLGGQMAAVAPASLGVADWACQAATTATGSTPAPPATLTAGSIAQCRPATLPADGEYPVTTVLVLDDAGTFTAAQSGIAHPLLSPGLMDTLPRPIPPGLNCTDLLAPDSAFTEAAREDRLTPAQTYFGVVLYYFRQDRSPLMDIDDNGIPCETLIDPSVVNTVWGGGWIASRFD
jgi:hypothetical protein